MDAASRRHSGGGRGDFVVLRPSARRYNPTIIRTYRTIIAAAFLLLQAACVSDLAVQKFAKDAKRASELLPRAAAIPFDACVEQHIYQQVDSDGRTVTDRAAAAQACATSAQARDRQAKEYAVLGSYMGLLGKLASRSSPAGDSSANSGSAAASSGDKDDSTRQAALAGLSRALADIYLRAQPRTALHDAITAADPHVQVLCSLFKTEMLRASLLSLDNQETALRAMYSDAAPSGPLRLILYRQFESELNGIHEKRELANRYAALLGAIAKTHAELYASRDRLRSRGTLEAIAQDAGSLGEEAENIQRLTK